MNEEEQSKSQVSTLSREYLKAHQGDIHRYRDAVRRSSSRRFGPAWWGVFEEHVSLGAEPTIVDLGTGTGELLELLRARHPAARLVGVEVQPLMVASAREVAARCGGEIVEADLALPLPIDAGTADVVTSVMTFHELMYPPQLLAEARRLLKPGGMLVLYDWVKRPLADYLQSMDRPLSPSALDHFREHCLFSAEDLAFLVRDAGFEIREFVGRRAGRFALVVAEAVS